MARKKAEMNNVTFETRPLQLSGLEETFGNPQIMEEAEYQGLVRSIKSKGFILDDPVVWQYDNGKYRIISGHHRIKAASEAGYAELNCKIVTGITDKQARLLVVEANRRRGRLDSLKLERYIQDLVVDFDISLDEINLEIGAKFEDAVLDDEPAEGEGIPEEGAENEEEAYNDLQKESESLTLTIRFKSFEEKEQFIDILDYYGNRGRAIDEKIKNFVFIALRDMKAQEANDEAKAGKADKKKKKDISNIENDVTSEVEEESYGEPQ